MPQFVHDGITFHFHERGEGTPFVFQHGLGGDTNQIFDLFAPPPGIRLITLDCRAHGLTQPAGDPAQLGFSSFADDVMALVDHLGLGKFVVGGISMGAGVALNLAARRRDRVQGLVLARPAWLNRGLPPNTLIYPAIAFLLRTYGVEEAHRRIAASGEYERMVAESPDAADSLLLQVDQPLARERAARLERIPTDCPWADLDACRQWSMPVLVLGNRHDPIHPFDLAQQLAASFADVRFVEITAKAVSKAQHQADVQAALETFLNAMR